MQAAIDKAFGSLDTMKEKFIHTHTHTYTHTNTHTHSLAHAGCH